MYVAPSNKVPLGISTIPPFASNAPLASKVPDIETVPFTSEAPLTVMVLLAFTVNVFEASTTSVAIVFVLASTVTL